jgi:hypothetical protein
VDQGLSPVPQLKVYQALWAMTSLQRPEESLGAKFDRVAAAGFDGMTIDLGALSMAEAQQCVPHFARTGLAAGLTAFPASEDELKAALSFAHRLQAPYLVVIGQDMPLALGQTIDVVERWLKVAERESMPLQFETHRNCITNDLFTAVQLLAAVPDMRFAADLSHYVVDREMPCPPSSSLAAMISQILAAADSFQGRIAARGQIQIPLAFPQNAKWVQLFKDWWLEGFRMWRHRHPGTLRGPIFLCELGPPDYAMIDAQGHELSDRWLESLQLADWARQLWTCSLATHPPPSDSG